MSYRRRTGDSNEFAATACDLERNVVDNDLLGRSSHGWTTCSALSITKNLAFFTLGALFRFELTSLLHSPCSILSLFVIDSRVDQLHMAIALRNPSVGCCRGTRLPMGLARCRGRVIAISSPAVVEYQGAVSVRSSSTSSAAVGRPARVMRRVPSYIGRIVGRGALRLR